MARRARKGVDYTQIIIIVAIVLAVGSMALFLANRTTDKFAGLKPLPISEFVNNGNSLSGSVFSLTGIVRQKPRFTANNGSYVFVEVDHNGTPTDLGIYLPVELQGTNLNIGDSFTAQIEVRKFGQLAFQEIK